LLQTTLDTSPYIYDVIIISVTPIDIEWIGNQWYPKYYQSNVPYKDKATPAGYYDSDEVNLASNPPMTIDDSGPTELKNTVTLGSHPIGEGPFYEICPKCEETLQLYGIKDNSGKTYRCRFCHQELVNSSRGWVIPVT
jgi:hypothetical protein